jgi:hypothetical protein
MVGSVAVYGLPIVYLCILFIVVRISKLRDRMSGAGILLAAWLVASIVAITITVGLNAVTSAVVRGHGALEWYLWAHVAALVVWIVVGAALAFIVARQCKPCRWLGPHASAAVALAMMLLYTVPVVVTSDYSFFLRTSRQTMSMVLGGSPIVELIVVATDGTAMQYGGDGTANEIARSLSPGRFEVDSREDAAHLFWTPDAPSSEPILLGAFERIHEASSDAGQLPAGATRHTYTPSPFVSASLDTQRHVALGFEAVPFLNANDVSGPVSTTDWLGAAETLVGGTHWIGKLGSGHLLVLDLCSGDRAVLPNVSDFRVVLAGRGP